MEDDTTPCTIVVGVSATSKSPAALRWAAEQAALLGGRVVAVRAWRPLLPGTASRGTPAVATPDLAAAEAAERESLAADVAEILGHDHPVEVRLIHGSKAAALLEAAQGADLIVIDTPPRTDLSIPPWFVDRLIHRAPCPVVIMPPGTVRQP
jgi:nucleotide-binding universal stress UspA family protein